MTQHKSVLFNYCILSNFPCLWISCTLHLSKSKTLEKLLNSICWKNNILVKYMQECVIWILMWCSSSIPGKRPITCLVSLAIHPGIIADFNFLAVLLYILSISVCEICAHAFLIHVHSSYFITHSFSLSVNDCKKKKSLCTNFCRQWVQHATHYAF
jgi:hypothetical protein